MASHLSGQISIQWGPCCPCLMDCSVALWMVLPVCRELPGPKSLPLYPELPTSNGCCGGIMAPPSWSNLGKTVEAILASELLVALSVCLWATISQISPHQVLLHSSALYRVDAKNSYTFQTPSKDLFLGSSICYLIVSDFRF